MNVYITRRNFDPEIHEEARRKFDEIYRRHHDGKIVILEAQYSRSQLQAWLKQAKPFLYSLRTIRSWGVSYTNNRIYLEITAPSLTERIRQGLKDLGIPPKAAFIKHEGEPELARDRS